MCYFNQFTSTDRDPQPVHSAIKEFDQLFAKYPGSAYEEKARVSRVICRDRLSQYELYVSRFYYKKGAHSSAIARLENLVKEYPDSSAEKEALYLAARTYTELGRTSDALKSYETLVRKYPSMQETAEPLIDKLRPK
jgi:outer membrane protein assembly factor BamD